MIKASTPSIQTLMKLYPEETLLILQDRSIMDKEAALRSYDTEMRLREIQEIHNYKIWCSEDGKWKTHIDKPDGTRGLVVRKERKDLIAVLAAHYHVCDGGPQPTMASLFPEWMQYKSYHTRSTKTLQHHKSDWNAYYEGTKITKVPIRKLTKLMLDEWIHALIKERQLTSKQYTNVASVVRQLLDYAVDRDIITDNPFNMVRIQPRLLITPLKKEAKTQVYSTEELNSLLSEAYRDFEETGDTSCLAIIICAKTGIRIGECMALKASDISEGYMHIRREEIIDTPLLPDGNFGPRDYVVVEHCKTDAGLRDIPVISEVGNVITMVRKANLARANDTDYLFIKQDGTKMHARSVDRKIRTLCERIGIAPRSAHKLRKTFISTLIDAGVNIDTVRRLAGHKDEAVTLGNYCFDRSSPEVIKNQLEKALG